MRLQSGFSLVHLRSKLRWVWICFCIYNRKAL